MFGEQSWQFHGVSCSLILDLSHSFSKFLQRPNEINCYLTHCLGINVNGLSGQPNHLQPEWRIGLNNEGVCHSSLCLAPGNLDRNEWRHADLYTLNNSRCLTIFPCQMLLIPSLCYHLISHFFNFAFPHRVFLSSPMNLIFNQPCFYPNVTLISYVNTFFQFFICIFDILSPYFDSPSM